MSARSLPLSAVLFLFFLSGSVTAGTADPVARGEAIARAADAQLHGYGDSRATLEMVLVSPAGETASRVLTVSSREAGSDGDRTLMVFRTPRDLAGTALLSWNHPQGDDEQWLYLPAVQRVKQIGARNKSGPFMASEFAYEDIVTPFWQKYRYRWLRDETLDGLPCAVVERVPLDPNSGYVRQLVWIDSKDSLIRRIDFFDRRDAPLKTYVARGFVQHAGKHWRPAEMHMTNLQTKKQTTLKWRDQVFGIGLQDSDFTRNALQRVK
ncbi:MAG: outer membrane lipoprotein-sorting protein [Pseudomonadota bacterium]